MQLLLALSLLFTLVSCEFDKNEETPATEIKRFDPLMVQGEDLSRFKMLCNELEKKEERLSVLVSSKYTFRYAQKGCEEEKLPEMVDMDVTIQRSNSDYVFRKNNGDLFAFPDVETSSQGVMADICSNLVDLKSPMQTSNKGAIWFSTCGADADKVCIYIEHGTLEGDINYQIHTKQWIKFKVNNERSGFFTERRIVSSADCKSGKAIERKAVLK